MISGLDSPKLQGPFDHPREECGVVGVYTPGGEASHLAFFGLFALQHRGQESAGIAAADGETISVHVDMGLVTQIFRERDFYPLSGELAIGHTRYSTTGSSQLCNAQPIVVDGYHGQLALAHNGNIINSLQLKKQLERQWNCVFSSTTDSEVVAHLLANAPGQTWEERVFHCMRTLEGAFSLVALTSDTLIAARDPLGIRPLCLGKLNGGWVIASESCALDHLGAKFLREVGAGEVIIIDKDGLRSAQRESSESPGRRALCVFELIYFARPDSQLDGQLVYSVRRKMGAQLAKEHPVEADLVIGIPDSSTAAAVGYARESGIPYSAGHFQNFCQVLVRGDQLMATGHVDSHVTWILDGRGADPHVDLCRSRPAQQAHHVGGGSSAHDAVVHNYQSLSLDYLGQGIELLTHSQVPQPLFRLDESASHVAIFDQPVAVGYP